MRLAGKTNPLNSLVVASFLVAVALLTCASQAAAQTVTYTAGANVPTTLISYNTSCIEVNRSNIPPRSIGLSITQDSDTGSVLSVAVEHGNFQDFINIDLFDVQGRRLRLPSLSQVGPGIQTINGPFAPLGSGANYIASFNVEMSADSGSCPGTTFRVFHSIGTGLPTSPPCQTGDLSATASTINAGQSTTLNYDTQFASSATITDLLTGVVTAVPVPSGSLVATPASTRTYRLTVQGPCAAITQDVTVTVNQTPTADSFTGTSPVCAGTSATLSWSSTGATSATITDLTSGVVTGVPVNGSLAVSPASTRTYRLTVTNGSGSSSLDATITVVPLSVINTYSATATTIFVGQSTTLNWTTSNSTIATITDLSTGTVTSVGVNSSLVVTPATTRTYRLTATGSCNSVTQDVTITVTQQPTADSFTSTSPICAGANTNQTWASTGATSATITDLSTGSVTSVPVNGSRSVSPATTRTYRFTATNAAGSASIDTTVVVTPLSVINNYSATSMTINAGQSTTLSLNVSNTSARSITDLSSGAVVNFGVESASMVVTPASTRTYRLTASSGCNTVTQDITITVTSCQTINSYSANSTTINAGQSTTLTWSTSGASAVYVLDVTAGTWTTHPAGNGSVVVTPASTRIFRLLVDGPCTRLEQDITITVLNPPIINTYSASASTLCAGGSATLTWTSTNGTSATITDLTSGTVTNVGVNSSLVVTPASTRTYRLTVTNGSGSVFQDVPVTVLPLAVINNYSASATNINAGQSISLNYNVSNSSVRSITDLSTGTVTSLGTEAGSMTVTPATSRTYRLTVTNGCNSITQDIPITVGQAPSITSFTRSASPICSGGSSTLSWASSGGTTATISAPGLPGSPVSVNPNSGTLVVSPTTTTTYTLTVTNGAGSVTQTTSVTVNPLTVIDTYSAAPPTVGPGGSSTLTWTSTNGTSATITDLTSGTVTNVGVNSSLVVTPASTRTYRLTVNGTCGAVTQDVQVTVTACQTLNSFTLNGSSTSISTAYGAPVVAQWNISNFTNAYISHYYEGVYAGTTWLTTNTGSLTFTQSATAVTVVLVVEGPCPQLGQALYSYTASCPTVAGSTFTASPSTINQFQSSTLAWNFPNAGTVTISIQGGGTLGTFGASGNMAVNPTSTTTYIATAQGVSGCPPVSLQTTVTFSSVTGAVLIGPSGHPGAIGPTSNNDDYTNMTLVTGVNVPTGGVTTAGGTRTFINTLRNNQGGQADTFTISAPTIPGGFTVEVNVGAGFVSLNGGATTTVTVAPNTNLNISVRITAPSGISVLTDYTTIIRARSGITPTVTNETIDRLWTGFVRAVKSYTVTNATGFGAANAPVPGAVIQYTITYSNITTSSGTNNVNLTATNVVLTENGNAAPNNWGTTTTHVAGAATDSLGGTITGDVAGSTLLTDTIPTLAPAQTGIFRFSRRIR